jgi:CMP-N,N'-diacetyllegionaminic acid synthase
LSLESAGGVQLIPRVLAVIPARGGSKGVPRKNIRLVCGKPLIAYTIETARAAGVFYRVIVSSDDQEIIAVSREYGADVPFVRPSELAQDETPMVPVIRHAVEFIEDKDEVILDYVCVLQPTEPLRTVNDIRAAIRKILDTGADSVISVCRMDDLHPVFMKRIENDRLLPFCLPEPEGLRRQDVSPPAYVRNGVVYVAKRDVLMKRNSLYGEDCRPYVMPPESYLTVDTELQLRLVELLLREQQQETQVRNSL